jgi:hypothetical protein
VRPYGIQRLVRIADEASAFAKEIDECMAVDANDSAWKARVDAALSQNSWDLTHKRMANLIEGRILNKELEAARATVAPAVRPISSAVLGD